MDRRKIVHFLTGIVGVLVVSPQTYAKSPPTAKSGAGNRTSKHPLVRDSVKDLEEILTERVKEVALKRNLDINQRADLMKDEMAILVHEWGEYLKFMKEEMPQVAKPVITKTVSRAVVREPEIWGVVHFPSSYSYYFSVTDTRIFFSRYELGLAKPPTRKWVETLKK